MNSTRRRSSSKLAAVASLLLTASVLGGQTLEVIHNFAAEPPVNPNHGLVSDGAGNLYGIAGGGAQGAGVVYRLDAGNNYTLSILHEFAQTDGSPNGALVFDTTGNLYGTTAGVTSSVFKLDLSGGYAFMTLHTFSNGSDPAGLVFDPQGNLFGVTRNGGANNLGTVFEFDSAAFAFSIVHDFSGPEGSHPQGDLSIDQSGNLFGTTTAGGAGWGTAFMLSAASGYALTTIYTFSAATGGSTGPLLVDSDGTLFGAATGASPSYGIVYRIDRPANSLVVLHSFTGGSDGWNVSGNLVGDGGGNLYGQTVDSFDSGRCCDKVGTIFLVDKVNGTAFTTLHTFSYLDGSLPAAPLVRGAAGDLYGVTTGGGAAGYGVAYMLEAATGFAETVLHDFAPTGVAYYPAAGLARAGGKLYGTTDHGGVSGAGTVFSIDAGDASSFSVLHDFCCFAPDLGFPQAPLLASVDGNLYGSGNYGIFRLNAMDGSGYTVLHPFTTADGSSSLGALIEDNAGYLYGTTSDGGLMGGGTVFRLDPTQGYTSSILHAFDVAESSNFPPTKLLMDGAGNLYGTAGSESCETGNGTVFRLDRANGYALTTLHCFTGPEGSTPYGDVIADTAGNLYGTTEFGGAAGVGTVFKLDATNGYSLTTLHHFENGPIDGAFPQGGLVSDNAGNLYGTTQAGGALNYGVIYELVKENNWALSILHDFAGPEGAFPSANLVTDSAGHLFGTTRFGGANLTGVIFRVDVPTVSTTPTGSSVSVVNGSVTTTYSTVSAAGVTTVTPIDPSTAGTLPAGGYALSGLGIAYEISTTATVSGNIIVAFVVPASVDEVTFNSLRILHGEGGSLVDRTYFSPDGCSPAPSSPCPAPNFSTRTIYAQVSSLSPFVLATNGKPVIQYITVPGAPVAVSGSVGVQARFTDTGTHTAVWYWDDGTTSTGVVTEIGGIGTVTGSHVYTAAGVYQATLTVTDPGGLSGQKVSPFIVIYDPSGGFVTGGGQFSSPEGADVAQPTLTGTSSFGFVAKYPRSGNVPTGETEFHFADLNLHSTSYDWLVITTPKGQYQGSGTVNGSGSYGFIVTLVDGQASGGDGTDKIRIKIWDKNNGNAIIYDDQMGAPDSANPMTAIGAGSIVLHR